LQGTNAYRRFSFNIPNTQSGQFAERIFGRELTKGNIGSYVLLGMYSSAQYVCIVENIVLFLLKRTLLKIRDKKIVIKPKQATNGCPHYM
jgi:hypothetical protein